MDGSPCLCTLRDSTECELSGLLLAEGWLQAGPAACALCTGGCSSRLAIPASPAALTSLFTAPTHAESSDGVSTVSSDECAGHGGDSAVLTHTLRVEPAAIHKGCCTPPAPPPEEGTGGSGGAVSAPAGASAAARWLLCVPMAASVLSHAAAFAGESVDGVRPRDHSCCFSVAVDPGVGGDGFVGSMLAVSAECTATAGATVAGAGDVAPSMPVSRMILKFAPDIPTDAPALLVETGLHQRECAFYRTVPAMLRPAWRWVIPECPWTSLIVDKASGADEASAAVGPARGLSHGVIALEDVRARPGGARTVALYDGMSVTEAIAGVRALAKIHASTWGELSTRVSDAHALDAPDEAAFASGLQEMYTASVAAALPAAEGDGAGEAALEVARGLARDGGVAAARARAAEMCPWTAMINGDCWCGNVLLTGDGACIVDWQFACRGNPVFDIACMLGTSMTASERRASTDDILKAYHDEVSEAVGDAGSDFLGQLRAVYRASLPGALILAVCSHETWSEAAPSDAARDALVARWRALAVDCAEALSEL